ncbi:MAG: RsmB/NOP family class I SAM-dependent RNA methyltransferase [Bdellovibrionales bacterium]
MRVLFAPLREGLSQALQDIFVGGWPADKVVQRHLKSHRKWGSSDRRLFAEGVYDIVRWWRRLLFACDRTWPLADGAGPEVFLTAVQEVIQCWCWLNEIDPGKPPSFTQILVSSQGALSRWHDRALPRAVRESLPDWLDAWAFEQLGERWNQVAPVLNTVAPVYLRANQLKITPEELVRTLDDENVSAEHVEGDTIRLERRVNVFLTKAFRAGLFEVQDLHSQRVAPALRVEPGQRIVDACAGAGGKSLHLAALMKNKGKIIALDTSGKKLDQLRERSTRAGATCIETRVIDSSKIVKRLRDSGDRLLLDVPCSGLGVLRRNPDSKWRLTLAEVQRTRTLQGEILQSYSSICKMGGFMVYATCSILPDENERQLADFLSRNGSRWEVEMQETLWPVKDGPDGFFLARLRRLS